MTATDLLLLAVIGASALLGVMRGLIGVLASLLAWVLAAWAAFHFGARVALLLSGGDAPGAGQLLAGYGLSFLGVLLFVGAVGWLVRKLMHSVGLSGMDRALGFMVGLVRGGLVACLLVLMMGFTALPHEPEWRQSQVVPVLLPGAQWLRAWLPEWAAERVDLGGGRPHSIKGGDAPASPQPGGEPASD